MGSVVKTYDEMSRLETFEDRLAYAMDIKGVTEPTFGSKRWLNQVFYKSKSWKRVRDQVILRDSGCDLGHPDCPISGTVYIHHLKPLTDEDILEHTAYLDDPRYLVCTSMDTHNALHYGSSPSSYSITERKPNDTCPWKDDGRN